MHPIVSEWFRGKFGEVTEAQSMAVPLIHGRRSVLVSSPTGSGKTLTAFLSIINELALKSQRGELEDRIYAVYVSPLKALANDINENLLKPLGEISALFEAEGLAAPGIKVAVRTGDTLPSERQRQAKSPPHIFITTPESLSLILSTPVFSRRFDHVDYVIVDEVHEICDSKRGAALSVALERLQSLSPDEFVRIGLSATVAPIEQVAEYLAGLRDGHPRDMSIVEVYGQRDLDLRVICPTKDMTALSFEVVNSKMYDMLKEMVEAHRTTLVFTNTRSGTESVVYKLKERGLEERRRPPRQPQQGDEARGRGRPQGRRSARGRIVHVPRAGDRHRVDRPRRPDRVPQVRGEGSSARRQGGPSVRRHLEGSDRRVRDRRPGRVRGPVQGRPQEDDRPGDDPGEPAGRARPDHRGPVDRAPLDRRRGLRAVQAVVQLQGPRHGPDRERPQIPRREGRVRGDLLEDMVRRDEEGVRDEARLEDDILPQPGHDPGGGRLHGLLRARLPHRLAVREVRRAPLPGGHLRPRGAELRVHQDQGHEGLREEREREEADGAFVDRRDAPAELRPVVEHRPFQRGDGRPHRQHAGRCDPGMADGRVRRRRGLGDHDSELLQGAEDAREDTHRRQARGRGVHRRVRQQERHLPLPVRQEGERRTQQGLRPRPLQPDQVQRDGVGHRRLLHADCSEGVRPGGHRSVRQVR